MKKSRWRVYTREKCVTKIRMIMRLYCLLTIAFVMQVSAEGVAQATVSAKFENQSLGEVLKELKQQTGVYFMYNTREVNARVKVSAEFQHAPLEQVLQTLFRHLPYTYSLMNDYVLITPGTRENNDSIQKSRLVKGIVKDERAMPLPGVTVVIRGTTSGTVTNSQGMFELKLPDGKNTVLVFSFIGMQKLELKADTTFLHVSMKEAVEEVGEVVVTGYERIEKRKLTSSILSVKGEDLLEGGAISIDQMLQGKLAGVSVINQTSTPGAAPKIRIRGSSSITGNREPVWVVDGVILDEPINIPAEELNSLDKINLIGNAISFLNPEDIERIDILKDASATAIYGTKAANGVIVVTTKKGKRGDTRFSYTTNLSVMIPPNNKNMMRMNSAERIAVSEEMHERGLEYSSFKPSNVAYEGALMDLWDKKISYDEFLDRVKAMKEMNMDWYDLLFRTSFSHQHTISISGGSDKADYYFSGGFANNESVTKHENLKRYNGMIKINTYFSHALKMGFKMNGSWAQTERPHSNVDLYAYAYNTSRTIPAYDAEGNPFYYAESNGYQKTIPFNIFNELKHSGSDVDNNSLNLSATLDWSVTSWLFYNMMFSFARNNNSQSYWADEQTHYISAMRMTPYGSILPSPKEDKYFAEKVCILPYGGELQNQETRNTSYTWRNSVALSKAFDKHEVAANVGIEIRSSKYDAIKTTQYGYLPERGKKFASIDITEWPRYAQKIKNTPNVITDTRDNFLSYYGTFSYGYDNRYMLNFNIRADGSNKFGQDKSVRFLPVWSVSGRWNISSERFFRHLPWIDDLSVRASYGVQGNVHPDQTPDLIVNIGTLDAKAREYSSTLHKFPNTKLKWEKTSSYNLGIDFSVFKGFVGGTVEIYRKKGKDQIISKLVPPATGANKVTINDGNVENRGWELSVNMTPVNTKDWTWGLSFNTGKNYNKVTQAGETTSVSWQNYVDGTLVSNGRPLNSFYSYKFDKLDANGLPTFKDMNEKDEQGNMIVHSQEEAFNRAFAYSGKREPDLSGGFSTFLRYRKISVSAQFAFNLGNKLRLNDLYGDASQTMPYPQQNMSNEYVNRWRKPGDEAFTNIPALSEESLQIRAQDYKYPVAGNGWEMYNNSDLRVVSGNFLRCRSLSLRYSLGQDLCRKLYMQAASISFDAGNLFVVKSKELKGRDPEQVDLGSHTIPPQKSYSVRLSVTF